jgi:type VI protein secretion system component Hcp
MAYEAFLKIDGIQGEQSNGTIEIDSFSFGVANTTSIGSATGGSGAGKASASDFNFTSKVGSQSPRLLESVFTNKVLENAQLTVTDKGAGSFLTIKFSEVLVSSYKLAEGPASLKIDDVGGLKIDALLPAVQKSLPTELVSFSFSQISFQTQSSTGNGSITGNGSNTVNWDLSQNKVD